MTSHVIPGSRDILLYAGHRVSVRLATEMDTSWFIQWRSELAGFDLMRFPESDGDLDRFVLDQLKGKVTGIITSSQEEKPLGFVQAYDLNLAHGWCYLMSYLNCDSRGRKLGLEATLGFWHYLFTYFNFRKIYIAIAGSNTRWLEELPLREIDLAVREAVFRDHLLRDGTLWDQEVYAIYQERWANLAEPLMLVARLGEQLPPESLPAAQEANPRQVGIWQADLNEWAHGSADKHALQVVTQHLSERLLGNADAAICLLEDDVVYRNPLLGEVQGKQAVGNLIRFAARLAAQGAGSNVQMNWVVGGEGSSVRFTAKHEGLEFQTSYEVRDGLITAISESGPPRLFAIYLSGAYPVAAES